MLWLSFSSLSSWTDDVSRWAVLVTDVSRWAVLLVTDDVLRGAVLVTLDVLLLHIYIFTILQHMIHETLQSNRTTFTIELTGKIPNLFFSRTCFTLQYTLSI